MADPVIVGGVGGSGTRVIAQILLGLGFYLGHDLNKPNDNLWFTVLFRRPSWLPILLAGDANHPALREALHLFHRLMHGHPPGDDMRLIDAAIEEIRTSHQKWRFADPWLAARRQRIQQPPQHDLTLWGWKEPNTHLFLAPLAAYFPHAKYVHVMRHGLDMAYSSNQNQLYNWGTLFDVDPKAAPLPVASLDYWIKSNQRSMRLGRQMYGDRFYVLNYDALCTDPAREVSNFVAFLGVDLPQQRLDELITLPEVPSSMGRYREYTPHPFRVDQLEAVAALGFNPG